MVSKVEGEGCGLTEMDSTRDLAGSGLTEIVSNADDDGCCFGGVDTERCCLTEMVSNAGAGCGVDCFSVCGLTEMVSNAGGVDGFLTEMVWNGAGVAFAAKVVGGAEIVDVGAAASLCGVELGVGAGEGTVAATR